MWEPIDSTEVLERKEITMDMPHSELRVQLRCILGLLGGQKCWT